MAGQIQRQPCNAGKSVQMLVTVQMGNPKAAIQNPFDLGGPFRLNIRPKEPARQMSREDLRRRPSSPASTFPAGARQRAGLLRLVASQ